MDFTQLANLGEFIGGVAVLVTLVYLAVQIRQGNNEGQRESFRGWVSELNKVLLEPQRDPEFMQLFQRANRDWNSISLRDQGVISSLYSQVFLLCDEIFSLREGGDLSPQLHYQIDMAVSTILQMPGPAVWWGHTESFYSPSFREHVDRLLASEDCPPPIHHLLPWYAEEATKSSEVQ